ncbi:unnamed protein product [Closterium sp. NIES-65]|nr:unnamed protein product [Closterium sp. NIES-65]
MEVRVVQSAATTAKPAESISEGASDARPTCTQLAAITPPEAAALVPEEDFSDIEETRVGSSHLRARCCQAYPSPLPSPSLIRSHPISALRCSSPSLILSHPISALRCSSPSLIRSHPISALRCSSPSLIRSHPISALRCSSPSLIRSHPISALRCSSPSPPLLVAPSLRLRFPLRHAPLSAYLPLTTQPARTRLRFSAPAFPFLALPPRRSLSPRLHIHPLFPRPSNPLFLLYLPGSSIPSPSFHPLIVPSSYIPPTAAPPSPPTAHVFPTDHVERYIHYKLHELFSLADPDRHVSILYIHTECESLNDNPLLAFRDIFQGLPPSLQQRVGAVYILHPSLTLRLGLWLMSPWLSDSLYSRMVCVSRVEFLWEHIREDQVDLPDFCLVHDGKLEAHPLLDYGFQLDRVAAGQHLPVGL